MSKLTLDAVFEGARRRDFRLCNFFQLEDGTFRCNWIVNGKGQRFGTHSDPVLCASEALGHAMTALALEEEDLIG